MVSKNCCASSGIFANSELSLQSFKSEDSSEVPLWGKDTNGVWRMPERDADPLLFQKKHTSVKVAIFQGCPKYTTIYTRCSSRFFLEYPQKMRYNKEKGA